MYTYIFGVTIISLQIGILATRHELVTYDIQHLNTCEQSFLKTPFLSETHYHQDFSKFMDQTKCLDLFSNFGKCYGCIALASKQCIFLLKNLAAISSHKICLIHLGLLTELCNINLRIGTSSMQNDVSILLFINFVIICSKWMSIIHSPT